MLVITRLWRSEQAEHNVRRDHSQMTTIWVCYPLDDARPERVFSSQEDASDWLMNYGGPDYVALEFDLDSTHVTGRFLSITATDELLLTEPGGIP